MKREVTAEVAERLRPAEVEPLKYLIKAKLEVDGKVDKHDVIGAIFGQTEGLLGSEFNLEKLQDKDKIGRVHVDIKYHGSKTVGTLQIPSNLDRVETAILAAMLETVDRIGPYNAKITVEEIKDLRAEKIKTIIERSKQLLALMKSSEPDLKEIIRKIEGEQKQPRLVEYGPEKLPAGPDIEKSDTIIIVEGRADVINMLRYGYTNVIALGGARERVPDSLKKLAEKKTVILFLDGDRGGDLILKNVINQLKIDYVARAPKGMEVERLTGKEIAEALSDMVPIDKVKKELEYEEKVKSEKVEAKKEEEKTEQKPEKPVQQQEAKPKIEPEKTEPAQEKEQTKSEVVEIPKKILDTVQELKGTLEAVLYDNEWNEIERIKVRDLYNKISNMEPGRVYAIVFDGIITQRIIEAAEAKGIKLLIGSRLGSKIQGRPGSIRFLTFNDIV